MKNQTKQTKNMHSNKKQNKPKRRQLKKSLAIFSRVKNKGKTF